MRAPAARRPFRAAAGRHLALELAVRVGFCRCRYWDSEGRGASLTEIVPDEIEAPVVRERVRDRAFRLIGRGEPLP